MSNEEFLDAFAKCTNAKTSSNGRVSIRCKLGLWGVDAPGKDSALNEALHYFQQYLKEGQYHEIIGGNNPLDILWDKGLL